MLYLLLYPLILISYFAILLVIILLGVVRVPALYGLLLCSICKLITLR
jgi:hypothetical protein